MDPKGRWAGDVFGWGDNTSGLLALELDDFGASVLHPRAVEIARNYGVNLVVRSSWSDAPGTRLTSSTARAISQSGLELGSPVDGAEELNGQAVIALSHIPDQPGIAARVAACQRGPFGRRFRRGRY